MEVGNTPRTATMITRSTSKRRHHWGTGRHTTTKWTPQRCTAKKWHGNLFHQTFRWWCNTYCPWRSNRHNHKCTFFPVEEILQHLSETSYPMNTLFYSKKTMTSTALHIMAMNVIRNTKLLVLNNNHNIWLSSWMIITWIIHRTKQRNGIQNLQLFPLQRKNAPLTAHNRPNQTHTTTWKIGFLYAHHHLMRFRSPNWTLFN